MSPAPVWQTALKDRASEFWQCHGELEQLRRLSAGASAETWQFDFVSEGMRYPCILRKDAVQTGGSMSLCIDKALEFNVVMAAKAAHVPVATPYFEFESGYVMQRLEGETLPRKILRDERFQVARANLTEQCAKALAEIHATTIADSLPCYTALAQLSELERLFRDYDVASPVFEVAFRWLKENAPTTVETTLVHGDFRNGNLMVSTHGLAGVLDWELAHQGDPVEDLGWLCVNAWRFGTTTLPVGGFGQREALLNAYARYSGRNVSSDRLHYWEVFGTLRWGIICLYQVFSHLRGVQFSLELAAIGRRIAEVEMDLLVLLCPRDIFISEVQHA